MLTGAIVSAQVAGVETRDQGKTGDEGDHLDDWFTRRLESHGISGGSRKRGVPRILALIGLAIALLGMFWALSAVGRQAATSSTTTSNTTTQNTSATNGTNANTGTNSSSTSAAGWQNVTVDVLNGFGGTNAAGTAASALSNAGYKVGITGNGGLQTTHTVVVFTAGHRADAKLIAKRLKLGFEPVAAAHGVPQTAVKNGVAVVVGPNGLPSTL